MKISVITVAYNCEATIADTIDSVAQQNHPDIEYIVVDGASRDRTLSIVEARRDVVTRWVSEPDRGIYDAMNKGMEMATGELIGFLNADDMFAHADVVGSIARAAQMQPDADVVYGDLVYVQQDHPDRVIRYWRSGEFSASKLRFGWMAPHPTLYVRRSTLSAIGPFDASLRIAGDYEFMLRCFGRVGAKAAYVRDTLVRMRAGGVSNRSIRAMVDKSREDLTALRRNRVGGWFSLLCKNTRKLPQFFLRA